MGQENKSPIMDPAIVPDWTKTWTAGEAEAELVAFEFKGPGWYMGGPDTMLVLPIDRPLEHMGHQRFTETERFRFHVWNDRKNVPDILCKIVYLPTRMDRNGGIC